MKKVISLLVLRPAAVGGSPKAQQTLFSYGPYKVDKREFVWAFDKNNVRYAGKPGNGQALRTYLDLYTNYKLKVRDARDARMDTTQDFVRDQRGFPQINWRLRPCAGSKASANSAGRPCSAARPTLK